MALNSRQKRARKRKLALAMLAVSRNPTTQVDKGHVRSSSSKLHKLPVNPDARKKTSGFIPLREAPWESRGKVGRSVKGKLVPKAVTKPRSSVPLDVPQLDAPMRKDLAALYPRERLQATKLASSQAARLRERKWGVKD